ncbi:phage integrase, partial [Vibrio sagamiensis]
ELWFTHYGATLANGSVIQNKFLKMADVMGNPIASSFTSKMYSTFRSQRMAGTIDFVDARWNEAAQLKGSQLSKFKVTFTNTKTKKNRSVPISEELYHEIYKPTSEKLFQECYTPFCYILKNKLGVTLPSGQASHVLRHTFASHFMMNGGNILVLRDILGHADISMTMRYAHFAPDHLSEAISHNPLSNL